MIERETSVPVEVPRAARGFKKIAGLSLALFAVVIICVFVATSKPPGPLAQLKLADGRILQIEAVTYGTHHHVGRRSIFVDWFGPWLPRKFWRWLQPKSPESTIELERPALVVWVTAINPETGTNVDCQAIRTEFVDQYGDLFGADTSSWSGGQTFWRVGHVFYSYPRDEAQLTFRVTPWKKNKNTPVTARLTNPRVARPENWKSEPAPQTKAIGPLEITLAQLTARTNDQKYWQTPSKYFEPVFELRRNGQPATGWSDPEWLAEDPTGNRSRFLGVHQPALRFSVTVYPTETNTDVALPVATLPRVNLITLTNQVMWNSKSSVGTNEIVALGVCPPGTYTFSDGNFDPSGPKMGAVRGGAPSGWTGTSQRVTPMKIKFWHGHYTPRPTLYVRAAQLREPDRLGLRLRDDAGRIWIAKPETQGNPDGVHAFLLELPPDVTQIVPELVLLRPVEANFLVETKSAIAP